MDSRADVKLTCTDRTFKPVPSDETRWWSKEDWMEAYDAVNDALGWGSNPPHRKNDWEELYDQGYRYCAALEGGRAVAVAGLWERSREAWEVIAVGVKAGEMSKGYGRAIVSFVTDEILKTGRKATITTQPGNVAMLRAAQSVGFE